MKRTLVIVTISLLLSSLATADDLRRLPLDDASTIGTTIQTDTKVKTEGKGSIKITTQWPTTICLGEVSDLGVENAKLVYRAKLRSELDGIAFLEMWAHVGGGQYFSKGMNDPITDKSDWKSISVAFIFKKGQRPDKVTLNIVINGRGTVWVDEVVLSKEPLE